jgi:hypothetical protein
MATNNQKSPMPHIIPGIISFIMDHLHRLAGNAFDVLTDLLAARFGRLARGCGGEWPSAARSISGLIISRPEQLERAYPGVNVGVIEASDHRDNGERFHPHRQWVQPGNAASLRWMRTESLDRGAVTPYAVRLRRCRHRHQRPDHPLLYCVARFAWRRSRVIANHKKTSPRTTNRGSRTRSICVFVM